MHQPLRSLVSVIGARAAAAVSTASIVELDACGAVNVALVAL